MHTEWDALIQQCMIQINDSPRISLKTKAKQCVRWFLGSRTMTPSPFSWPNALLATALEYAHKKNAKLEILQSLGKYYGSWIASANPFRVIDSVHNGYSLIYLHQITGNKQYKIFLDQIVEYVQAYPQDTQGGLLYRIGDSDTILVDMLGMVCPFLCRYNATYGNDNLAEMAVRQLTNFLKFGMDANTKLPYHGYDLKKGQKLGIIGWGRAMGWLLMGIVDSMEYLSPAHHDYIALARQLNVLIKEALTYQLPSGYFAWQLSAMEGPVDTSATSMIAYAIQKGLLLNIVESSCAEAVLKATIALKNSMVNGMVEDSSAESKGLSMYPQQYGAFRWSLGPTAALFSLIKEN